MVTFLGPFSRMVVTPENRLARALRGGPDGEDFVGQQRKVVAEPAVAEAVVVGVAVNHAGHDGAAGVVGSLGGRAFGGADCRRRCPTAAMVEPSSRTAPLSMGGPPPGVDQAVGSEDGVGGHGGHRWMSLTRINLRGMIRGQDDYGTSFVLQARVD